VKSGVNSDGGLPARLLSAPVTRLSEDDALALYHDADLLDLGVSAQRVRRSFHGDGPVTFLVDRNINYTNICVNRCRFCAFFRDEQSSQAFLLGHDDIEDRVDEAVRQGATQVMLQGGLHPGLGLEWFTTLFRRIKERHAVHLHSLSPPEIHHLAALSGETVPHVLHLLAEAGLDSLPGGGAEILVDHVRRRISPLKIRSAQWLAVMEAAHAAGIPTTATMMFGVGETSRDRIKHLQRVRDLQDRTGGFLSFIPWSFQPANTDLGEGGASTLAYLRTLAVSRIFLDNIPNIQGSWVTQGPEVGQISLHFGANDLGSIMLEENVVRAAGTSHRLTREEMVRTILATGYLCAQRDTLFNIIKACG